MWDEGGQQVAESGNMNVLTHQTHSVGDSLLKDLPRLSPVNQVSGIKSTENER